MDKNLGNFDKVRFHPYFSRINIPGSATLLKRLPLPSLFKGGVPVPEAEQPE
jgi:hypothetical protein